MMGEPEEARGILSEFKALSADQYVSPVNLAKVYVGLGEHEEVFRELEAAVAERSVKLPWLLIDPCLDVLRNDSRFSDIMKRLGIVY